MGGGGGEGAVALAGPAQVAVLCVLPSQERDVVARCHGHVALGRYLSGGGGDVVARLEGDVALGLHAAARLAGVLDALAVLGVSLAFKEDVLPRGHGIERNVAPGLQGGVACALYLGRSQVDVAASGQEQGACGGARVGGAAHVDPGLAVQGGAPISVVTCRAGGGLQVDVAPGNGLQAALGAQRTSGVVDVLQGLEHNVVALHGAVGVVEVLSAHLHHLAAQDDAVVANVSVGIDDHAAAREQRPAGAEVAISHHGIDLGNQDFFDAGGLAVRTGYGDRFFYQPHDVAGEAGDLVLAQCNARAQVVGLGVGNARVHERLVLLLVAGVVAQIAPPGELGYLVVDQLLLNNSTRCCNSLMNPASGQQLTST